MFATRGRVLRREELDDGDVDAVDLKILVVRCSTSKTFFAYLVERKGIDSEGYAATRLAEDIAWLGHTRLTLKTDNEPANVKLLR